MSGEKFKLKFDDAKSNQGDIKKDQNLNNNFISYEDGYKIRNLYLVLSNGKKLFLNYSFLINGEFLPDENIINLTFTSHIVQLKGYALEDLFESLSIQLTKIIVAGEQRYATIENKKSIVCEININKI